LWAPASGQEMRDSISKKVQNIGEQVGEGLRTEVRARPSGTEPL
jgi:formylmethanofuran dehydrogenase subunit C